MKGFAGGQSGPQLSLARPDGSYAGWTVIAGRNGSGKSTFLRALALSVAGMIPSRLLLEQSSAWVGRGVSQARAAAELTYGAADSLSTGGRAPGDTFWAGIEWRVDEKGALQVSEWIPKGPKLTARRGPWAESLKGWFLVGYGPFRRVTGAAGEAQRLMSDPYFPGRLVSLFREDSSLLEATLWLRELDYRSRDNAAGVGELVRQVLRLLSDDLLPDGAKAVRVSPEGLHVERLGLELALTDLSDGYRTVVALILDIIRHLFLSFGDLNLAERDGRVTIEHQGVVLIDEIDAHLHVEWQQRIGHWLKQHFPNIQFIVTTHSPFVCQAADPNGLIRLHRVGDRYGAELVDDKLFKQIINGTVDQAVVSALFGLDHSHSEASEALRSRQLLSKPKPSVVWPTSTSWTVCNSLRWNCRRMKTLRLISS